MRGREEQPTTVISAERSHSLWRTVLTVALVAALMAGTATAGFFVGQNTRKSDREVAVITQTAVAAETEQQEAARRKALSERKARDKATLRRVVRKMKKSADRKAEQSYASGQNVGFSSGHATGKEEGEVEGYVAGSVDGYDSGLTDASDDLTCSDDPDVYWLPSC